MAISAYEHSFNFVRQADDTHLPLKEKSVNMRTLNLTVA